MRRGLLLLLLIELRGALLRLLLRLMRDDCFGDCSFLPGPALMTGSSADEGVCISVVRRRCRRNRYDVFE